MNVYIILYISKMLSGKYLVSLKKIVFIYLFIYFENVFILHSSIPLDVYFNVFIYSF